jgi:hypothetical protein
VTKSLSTAGHQRGNAHRATCDHEAQLPQTFPTGARERSKYFQNHGTLFHRGVNRTRNAEIEAEDGAALEPSNFHSLSGLALGCAGG